MTRSCSAAECNGARNVRVNPRDGSEATELDLSHGQRRDAARRRGRAPSDILRQLWGMPASYVKLARAFGPGVTLQGLRFDGDYPMAADRSQILGARSAVQTVAASSA